MVAGLFEISQQITLTKEKIDLINNQLSQITEPLGVFTEWLKRLFLYIDTQKYRQSLLNYFLPDIQDQLSLVFYHVIDTRYTKEMSHAELKNLHDGLS